MTNGDKIRDMSYKDMAALFRKFAHCPCPAESCCRKLNADCERAIQGWLNHEVKDE